jgi:hypothetical protein
MRPEQAVIFLTHLGSERILRHFARLQRETAGLLDCYLCVDIEAGKVIHESLPQHLRIDRRAGLEFFPRRTPQGDRAARLLLNQHLEFLWLPLMVQPPLDAYDYVWMLEYDVDYSGHWGVFFRRVMASRADLLASYVSQEGEFAQWRHWQGFEPPCEIPAALRTRAFMPLARFSRRALTLFRQTFSTATWNGHYEAVLPTLARYAGLSLEDLDSLGPFLAYADEGSRPLPPCSEHFPEARFRHRPVVGSAYFHERRKHFPIADRLYHPVKPGDPKPGLVQRLRGKLLPR